jgi:hypothetical protein
MESTAGRGRFSRGGFATRLDLGESDLDDHVQRVAKVRGISADSLTGYRDMMRGSL